MSTGLCRSIFREVIWMWPLMECSQILTVESNGAKVVGMIKMRLIECLYTYLPDKLNTCKHHNVNYWNLGILLLLICSSCLIKASTLLKTLTFGCRISGIVDISNAFFLVVLPYYVTSMTRSDFDNVRALLVNIFTHWWFPFSGILVPGGFGQRGIEGKILAANWARTKKVPYLGK